ncbi:hypothetical protein BDV95DRAFT_563149 [Massariosphaeria phaeospora]|uniref:SET domain-containing protein n=1 Tax=Massariosphaeria phaeospora TaxID=100035 RepID=A0A7C8IJQ2_9PLEO|nr:hypothetical protein BDV95DRAFT_563149 [Massariosphaeria phaeospora]
MQTLAVGSSSPFFEIRHTPHSGRAIFATRAIPADTLVWRSDDLTLSVLLRAYRREVCGQCFGYEHGHDLNIRNQTVGFAFCNEECQNKWKEWHGDIGVQAWTAVEKLVKGRSKEDNEMVDADLPRPKSKEIIAQWESVATQAALIRVARQGERAVNNGAVEANDGVAATKQHRKALQKALQQLLSPDVMCFCVCGILWKYAKPAEWDRLLALAVDTTPYPDAYDLRAHTRTYLHLLAILPLALLPIVTAETLFLLSSRDSHNAFGIRSLEDDGSEFFGYGCWPAASYFNHSCGPTIEKRRVGRTWEFRVGRDVGVGKGEELSITYLSNEERKWNRGQRVALLKKNWGFDCACARCEGL